MGKTRKLSKSLDEITANLRSFIELSLAEDEKSWGEWVNSISREISVRCWERKSCTDTDCVAYKSECGRCWLLVGNLCCNSTPGEPDKRGRNCLECEIYLENVCSDPVSEVQEQIITLVHNLRTRQIQLKELATIDSLTGLKNRNFFDMYISHEVEKVKRGSEILSVIMIDVDDFKYINDAYGHLFGDKILKECAAILQNSIRASDILFRFGGDEFVIIMTDSGEDHADILIQRIRNNLAVRNGALSGKVDPLSLSIGHAMLTEDRELSEVINEADRMMYEEKLSHKKAVAADG